VVPTNGGSSVRLGAGDIVRITDITGSGHITSFIDNCTYAVMPLDA